jgi:hypothetical protein
MIKKILFTFLLSLVLVISGCGQTKTDKPKTDDQKTQTGSKSQLPAMADVCNYFPKELIESAIGRSIVKVETPFTDNKTCFYYTLYTDTYDHTPYGDKPGGTQVVAVYDDSDFAKDKVSNEKSGSVYAKDESIPMDNYVVRNNAGKIWQVVLILGQDKYIRMHFIQNAVTGEELLKIGIKFAEKIQASK